MIHLCALLISLRHSIFSVSPLFSSYINSLENDGSLCRLLSVVKTYIVPYLATASWYWLHRWDSGVDAQAADLGHPPPDLFCLELRAQVTQQWLYTTHCHIKREGWTDMVFDLDHRDVTSQSIAFSIFFEITWRLICAKFHRDRMIRSRNPNTNTESICPVHMWQSYYITICWV